MDNDVLNEYISGCTITTAVVNDMYIKKKIKKKDVKNIMVSDLV
jgi:hypothetical protein